MNRLGMMVDVSHSAPTTFWDVIKLSKAPIIASHSGCKAVNDVDRNLDDEQLKALAKNGGVVQIVALASYLKADSPERAEAVRKLREETWDASPAAAAGRAGRLRSRRRRSSRPKRRSAARPTWSACRRLTRSSRRATLKDFVDHIDHAVKVAGIDHVGIGTDFDGGGGIPGFNDALGSAERDGGARPPRLLRAGHREDLGRQPPARLAGRARRWPRGSRRRPGR